MLTLDIGRAADALALPGWWSVGLYQAAPRIQLSYEDDPVCGHLGGLRDVQWPGLPSAVKKFESQEERT